MTNEQLVLKVVKGKDLSERARSEVLDLCSRAFEVDYEPFLRALADATHILARQRDVLVSHALWVTRWLQCGDSPPMRTAYVEGVATEEAYWGQGLATAVMQRLASEIGDFELGALSPARPGLYARLGWEFWRGPLLTRTAGGLLFTPGEAVMILRLPNTPALDLDAPLSVEWREGEVW
jgi:aminoglycoside 2'-N-acetyltransferase I